MRVHFVLLWSILMIESSSSMDPVSKSLISLNKKEDKINTGLVLLVLLQKSGAWDGEKEEPEHAERLKRNHHRGKIRILKKNGLQGMKTGNI